MPVRVISSRADVEVRDKAVKALERYLRSAKDITESELRKIWKALFYCFWHSDKPKVQADLAERLAGLMDALPDGKAWLFLQAFWTTMTREWTLIDRLRHRSSCGDCGQMGKHNTHINRGWRKVSKGQSHGQS